MFERAGGRVMPSGEDVFRVGPEESVAPTLDSPPENPAWEAERSGRGGRGGGRGLGDRVKEIQQGQQEADQDHRDRVNGTLRRSPFGGSRRPARRPARRPRGGT